MLFYGCMLISVDEDQWVEVALELCAANSDLCI